jgi:pantoate--beta-alanine ligase
VERLNTVDEWRSFANATRRGGDRVGLVATMGALHEGHLSLVRAARERGDVVVMTSFVNPRQFSDAHDLAAYPRTPDADVERAAAGGVDALVTPSLSQMWPDYPGDTLTTVSVKHLGDVLEGEGRPGHFDGVASVVAKLLAISGPCRAYFGEKDFQQLVVVRRMVRDLSFDVEVVAGATQRASDGLALSSRNSRLSPRGRTRATAISRALFDVRDHPGAARDLRATMRRVLESADVEVAYADVVDVETLAPVSDDFRGLARAVIAGIVEGVRLIDNVEVDLGSGG